MAHFFKSEQASGVMLLFAAILSMLIANSYFGKSYLNFFHTEVGIATSGLALKYSVENWINDGLMAIFFLLVGLEIKRELYVGELSNPKSAALPIFAALGGMAVPIAFYSFSNWSSGTLSGAGIPMATDIAFVVGALALLGNRAPTSLKIFLTALAIIDDLGAIIVIALFYVSDFSFFYLMLALGMWLGLFMLNRRGVRKLAFYLIPGLFIWYFMLRSGVHATIAGVLLAFALPFSSNDEESQSYQVQRFLQKPVNFLIVPLFALANTGVVLQRNWVAGLTTSNSLGIFAGLFFGKAIGIVSASFLAIKSGLSRLPNTLSWKHMIGAGFLGGIGFTMSIFITLLAFDNPDLIQSSKISILLSSLAAGTVGLFILSRGSLSSPPESAYQPLPISTLDEPYQADSET